MSTLLEEVSRTQDLSGLSLAEMEQLAAELRQCILEVVSKNGGHLAPSLGVVELTIALHRFLDLPHDELVWDVGHQTYAHKILSGRLDEFASLRCLDGLSGFPKPYESEYDAFVAGHSSTSVSVAVGLVQAAKLKQEQKRVVAVVGDGAMTGGMIYEALNHGGGLKEPFTVILNDNKMSISENVGSMSRYLTRLRSSKRYQRLKQRISHRLLKHPDHGESVYRYLERFRDSIKYFLVQGVLFEEMGFVYLGPVDGHNIKDLLNILEKAQDIDKPTLVHVITKKGKGYAPAELNPTAFHGTGAFNLSTGSKPPVKAKTYTGYFADALLSAAAADEKIVGVTAAMPDGTGLKQFAGKYPERYFDVGIAEQHAVTFSAALAARGLKPVFAVYSTFLQRAYDQVLHDVCLADVPVVLAIDRAGIVGDDGETHQGLFDLAMLRTLPNMNIMAPRDGEELQRMLTYALTLNSPVAIRYPRGAAKPCGPAGSELELGRAELLRTADPTAEKKLAILALGKMVSTALTVAEALAEQGIAAAVCDLRFAKPLDETMIVELAREFGRLVVMEDGVIAGGVGSACLELLQAAQVDADGLLLGFPDRFIPQGKPDQLFDIYGLSAPKITEKIMGRWF